MGSWSTSLGRDDKSARELAHHQWVSSRATTKGADMNTKTKQLTAQELFDWLKQLKKDGVNLKKVDVNYRHDYDSDVEEVCCVDEDLRDPSDNETLISICLVTEPEED
jgi:hypothetical protein